MKPDRRYSCEQEKVARAAELFLYLSSSTVQAVVPSRLLSPPTPRMWNPCNDSLSLNPERARRKLVKARKVSKNKVVPFTDYGFDDAQYCQKMTDDFESDVAWIAAWDKRKKAHVFWCSRVLRKLRRKDQDTTSSQTTKDYSQNDQEL